MAAEGKQDYNFATPKGAWDESSGKAHWRNRKTRPTVLFRVKLYVCHQGQIFRTEKKYLQNTKRLTPGQRHDSAKVSVPPIHPDARSSAGNGRGTTIM